MRKETCDAYGLRRRNTSTKYTDGKVFPTNHCGNITIIGQIAKERKKAFYCFLVQFADGTQVGAERNSIAQGSVRNPNRKTFFSVGYMGEGPHLFKVKSIHTKEGNTWYSMLERVYSAKYQKRFPTYIGCTLSPRWHNFQNFCEDIVHLTGYTVWKNNTKAKAYHLDKDHKIKGNKEYSKDTCEFISGSLNSTLSNITGLIYVGERISDGYLEEFTVQRYFSKKHGLAYKNVNKCLMGGAKTHKGWKFKIKEELEGEMIE